MIWRIFDWNSNKTNSFWSTLIFSWYFATKLHTWLTHMIQCDFNQQLFTKASFKSKNKWSNWPEICYEKHFFHCFLFFMWMWKWEIKVINILKYSCKRRKTFYVNRYTKSSNATTPSANKLVQQLQLVLKMFFLVLVYQSKIWNLSLKVGIVKIMKIMLLQQDGYRRKLCSWYCETFWWLSKFSFHQK